MPGNNDWSRNFKDRCEDVGWRVDISGGSHFKVFDQFGKLLFTFASTPGDKRGMLNALSQAKRAGIETLESKLKLKRERDRLQKIEDDRKKNNAKMPPSVQFTPPTATKSTAIPAESPTVDLGSIDGVRIAAVAPALIQTPVMPKPAPLSQASEVLLVDGTVLYRCERSARYDPNANGTGEPGICGKVFAQVTSLQAHVRFHKRWESETGGDNNVEFIASINPEETTTVPTKPTAAPSPTTALAARIESTLESVNLLSQACAAIKADLVKTQEDIAKLQVADEATLQKAAQFDNLKAMLS